MAIKTGLVQRREVPHEEGQWFDLRELGHRALKRARDESAREGRRQLREMGGELYEVLQKRDETAERRKRKPDVLTQYDIDVLLEEGIDAWSYSQPLNDKNRSDLDDKTAEWAARSILELAGIENPWHADLIETTAKSVDRYALPGAEGHSNGHGHEVIEVDPTSRSYA